MLVHEDFRNFLGFKWKGQYYRYRILLYGLACSPYYFCKLLRVAAYYLRSQSIRTCFYMDDILIMAQEGAMRQDMKSGLNHSTETWLANKFGEVRIGPCQGNKLHWIQNSHKRSEWVSSAENSHRADPQAAKGYSASASKGIYISPLSSTNCRPVRQHGKSSDSSKAATSKHVSTPSAMQYVGGQYDTGSAYPERPNVVAQRTASLEWEDHFNKARRIADRDRCFPNWVGSIHDNYWKMEAGFWDTNMSLAPSNARELTAVIMAVLSFREELAGKAVQILTDNISTEAYIMHLGGLSPGLSRMEDMLQTQYRPHSQIPGWERQSNCRPSVPSASTARVETPLCTLQTDRYEVGQAHSGPVCQSTESSDPSLQFHVLGPMECGGRCSGPRRLGPEQQFCELPLQSSPPNNPENSANQGKHQRDSSMVVRKTMVPTALTDDRGHTHASSQKMRGDMDRRGTARTTTQPALAAENNELDPVETLHFYMESTASARAQVPWHPVFLSLHAPYHGLTADTIRDILDTAIVHAGLAGQIYSAKCFSPTGATYAVQLGYDPNVIMKIGRWKTSSMFFYHYVHAQIPLDYTDNLLNHD